MSRIVKKPEVRRRELLDIAIHQFMKFGYEKTSIRSIVKEAGGEVGMFYHHFSSKEEIFYAALQRYNENYITDVKRLIEKEKDKPFLVLMKTLLLDMNETRISYLCIQPQVINLQMLVVIHQATLVSLVPLISDMLKEYIKKEEIIVPKNTDVHTITTFLLYGISGIIHDEHNPDIESKITKIQDICTSFLKIA